MFFCSGVPYCPKCGKKIEKQTLDQIVDNIMELEEGTKIQILAPDLELLNLHPFS